MPNVYIYSTEDFNISQFPLQISPGDIIVMRINEKASEQEKMLPWVGKVTKKTLTLIHFDWLVPNSSGVWKSGLVAPKNGKTKINDVIAKVNYRIEEKMPCKCLDQLKGLSGIRF